MAEIAGTRRPRLLSNALANYAGQLMPLVVGVALTPLIISRLGDAGFGIWTLVIALQGLGGLLDLGITRSVVKYVAAHHAAGDTPAINRVVSSSFFLHLAMGLVALAGVAAGASWGLPFLQLSAEQVAVARPALFLAGATLALALPLGVLGGMLTGLQQYERSNAVSIAQTLLTAAATVATLAAGAGPVALVAVNGVGLVLGGALKGLLAARAVPGFHLSPRLAGWDTLRQVGGYSVWLFLIDLAERIFYYADAVLIAAFLPVSAVTAYNLGFRPASAVGYLAGPFVAVLLPAAAALQARRASGDLQRMLGAGTRLALGLTLPGVLWLGAYGRSALEVWVGPGHEDALPVLWVFLGVFLVSAAQNPAGTLLRGVGGVRPLAGVVFAEYAANIALSLWLIPQVGPVGAALGTLIPAVAADVGVIPWLACRAVGARYAVFLRDSYGRPLMAAIPVVGLLAMLRAWQLPPWPALLLGGMVTLVAYGALYGSLAAGVEETAVWKRAWARVVGGPPVAESVVPDDFSRSAVEHHHTDPQSSRPAAGNPGDPGGADGRPGNI
ncbi:MAG TPA: oligosaccharide flippase family protein [Chloroflexia bacterium]|nr:oligosaccharide flippase family protein [Chloroflexia bacterium]